MSFLLVRVQELKQLQIQYREIVATDGTGISQTQLLKLLAGMQQTLPGILADLDRSTQGGGKGNKHPRHSDSDSSSTGSGSSPRGSNSPRGAEPWSMADGNGDAKSGEAEGDGAGATFVFCCFRCALMRQRNECGASCDSLVGGVVWCSVVWCGCHYSEFVAFDWVWHLVWKRSCSYDLHLFAICARCWLFNRYVASDVIASRLFQMLNRNASGGVQFQVRCAALASVSHNE